MACLSSFLFLCVWCFSVLTFGIEDLLHSFGNTSNFDSGSVQGGACCIQELRYVEGVRLKGLGFQVSVLAQSNASVPRMDRCPSPHMASAIRCYLLFVAPPRQVSRPTPHSTRATGMLTYAGAYLYCGYAGQNPVGGFWDPKPQASGPRSYDSGRAVVLGCCN